MASRRADARAWVMGFAMFGALQACSTLSGDQDRKTQRDADSDRPARPTALAELPVTHEVSESIGCSARAGAPSAE